MLTHLLIRNLAVVDEIEVELTKGLTVLTGETGAGKSILIDALGLALGERADSEAVRAGANRAEVAASFTLLPDSAAALWLEEHDLDDDQDGVLTCVLRRVVTSDGRSRGYINGNTTPMQTLRELGDLLVDICGQQAHQSLARPDSQRNLLDQHGGHQPLVKQVRQAHHDWQQIGTRYTALESKRSDQAARLELLEFQVRELEALDARPGELQELDQAQRMAANASRIYAGAGNALESLYEGDGGDQTSAHDLISRARETLAELSELDPAFAPTVQMLKDAEIQVSEAAEALRLYLRNDQADGNNLDEIESRLGAMHDLARKHRIPPAELPELTERLRDELFQIENADDTLTKLAQELEQAESHVQELCSRLSDIRAQTAGELEQAVTANMRQLGMPDGSFSVQFETLAQPGPTGVERVEFRVAINPGMRPGALGKIASGGELSRISLAIQVASSANAQTPTLIFDEVDAGVGGGTADIVGTQLRFLAADSQVMCVTHLPQVASKGHEHFRVSKLSDGQNTRTRVAHLTREERIEELARMLGGVKITQRTRAHAEEMLDSAEQQRDAG